MRESFFSRPDGKRLRDIDPFMQFFPFIMKNRNESAIYFKQEIDITAVKAFLHERNRAAVAEGGSGIKMTLFHVILASLVRIIAERPQMNRFVVGRRVYQRNDIKLAFVMKREFKDDAKEEIVVMTFAPEDTLDTLSDKLQKEIHRIRSEAKKDDVARSGIVNWFNVLMLLPRFVLQGFVSFVTWLDYHGWLPRFVIDLSPMHTSVFISNLGSLGIDAPFHHLYEFGTTPIFLTIGVSQKVPKVLPDGSIGVREVVNLAVTLDERIGDGFYYARSLKRFQQILENPHELEKPWPPRQENNGDEVFFAT
ncbi:MAG: 2-oxo acid dehydrogenase subunit E2 [Eubacteriales bacterium]|nr:2-oxo acid dehydrogenase subunit E2 [Eubacteriales bacterium]